MALSHLVVQYESNFCTVALQFMEEEKNYPLPSPATTGTDGNLTPHLAACGRPGTLRQNWHSPSVLPRPGLRYQVLPSGF